MVNLDKGHGKKQLPGLALRILAASVLAGVLEGESFRPLTEIDMEDPRDRALANRLVTIALRRHGHLNEILARLLKRGVPARSGTFEAVLRLGLTQLLFMPDQAAHAALHLSVEVLRQDKRGSRFDKLLNAVLRQAQREADKWQAIDKKLLFPKWLRDNWVDHYGPDILPLFADALLAGAPLDLTLKDNDPELAIALAGWWVLGDTLRIEKRDKPVAEMPFYKEGRWWVQDAAAAIPARLFSLEPGARVLDMCAAPGGKTAQLLKAGYRVTALDNDGKRLRRVSENLSRLHYSGDLVEGDAQNFSPKVKFDGILLDAPCSSTGTFRRHPEVIWHRTKVDIAGRVNLQCQMIANAVGNLRSGGTLIYCVCSLQKNEGEDLVAWALQNCPQLNIDPIGGEELDGLDEAISPEGFVRTHPAQVVSGMKEGNVVKGSLDGFFIARFSRA